MQVSIKDFAVTMEVKNTGIEFEVRDNDGKHKGDCYVTKTGFVWCGGRTTRENGIKVSWDEFIASAEASAELAKMMK